MREPVRAATTAAAAALLFAAGACSSGGRGADGPPEVTFEAAGTSVVARPTQLCDVSVQDCTADPDAAVVLRVTPGEPVRITVPETIGETPWLVVFGYRTASGEKANARSDLFAADERTEYTLTTPAADDQLETVEVQQLGGTFVPSTEGVDFPTRGTWVLSIDDR